jgi:hypothetical protein
VYARHRCSGIDRQHRRYNLSTKLDFIYYHALWYVDTFALRAYKRAVKSTLRHLNLVDNGAAVTPLSCCDPTPLDLL